MAGQPAALPVGRRPPSLWQRLGALYARRETIVFLTMSNLKSGHRDKVLGNLWNLLDPLMFMLVYYFVFGVLFRLAGGGRDAQFMLYILIAVLVWRFVQGAVSQGATCIRGNRGLIHEINFPKGVFPVSVALSRFYDLLWGLLVLLVAMIVTGTWPTLHALWLPVLLLLTFLFVMGLVFIVAFLGVFFADTSNVLEVVLRLLFYLSPIFYYVRPKPGLDPEHVFLHNHPTLWQVYMLNPIAVLFECVRDVLLWGDSPEPRMMIYLAAVSIGLCVIGFVVFSRGEGTFAKYI